MQPPMLIPQQSPATLLRSPSKGEVSKSKHQKQKSLTKAEGFVQHVSPVYPSQRPGHRGCSVHVQRAAAPQQAARAEQGGLIGAVPQELVKGVSQLGCIGCGGPGGVVRGKDRVHSLQTRTTQQSVSSLLRLLREAWQRLHDCAQSAAPVIGSWSASVISLCGLPLGKHSPIAALTSSSLPITAMAARSQAVCTGNNMPHDQVSAFKVKISCVFQQPRAAHAAHLWIEVLQWLCHGQA